MTKKTNLYVGEANLQKSSANLALHGGSTLKVIARNLTGENFYREDAPDKQKRAWAIWLLDARRLLQQPLLPGDVVTLEPEEGEPMQERLGKFYFDLNRPGSLKRLARFIDEVEADLRAQGGAA